MQRKRAGWVPMYDFKTKSEMLRSGVLEKGDIIWIWNENDGGKNALSPTHHIGFFWGRHIEPRFILAFRTEWWKSN